MNALPPTDARPADRGITRRQFAGATVVAGVLALTGCASPSAPSGGESGSVTDGGSADAPALEDHRDDIVERYATGRAARREASRLWLVGRDAWELKRFAKAARAWRQAGHRFDAGRREFALATRDCRLVGATRGERICADAREYCDSMSKSASAHSAAAVNYRQGEFDAGETYLDEGFAHYESALDHEVRDPGKLRAALRADAQR